MRIAVGILIAGIAASANAGVIFSNLGPGDSFGTLSGWVVGNRTTPFGSTSLEIAAAFTPASDTLFTGADLATQLFGQPGDLTVALMVSGLSGIPDTTLETFIVTPPMDPALLSVQSALNPLLSAGTEYWLDMFSSSSAAVWLDNDQGARGAVASNQNGRGFVLLTDFGGNSPVQPAFRVSGDPIELFVTAAADVPEPSTFVFVVAGLLLIHPLRLMREILYSRRPLLQRRSGGRGRRPLARD
jgi:hypothetical protein